MRYNVSGRSVAYVRDRIQSLMTCRVSIYDSGNRILNPDTGRVTTSLTNPWYTGKARIWESSTGATVMMGDAAVTLMQTNISIPIDSGMPKKDQIVVVHSAPQDTDLEGRAFRVIAVDGGGQIGAARRMTVTAYTDSDVWER